MNVSSEVAILARAVTDEEDRLTSADEALATLQLRCGGDIPGVIAIPALLETVRKARRYQLKLGRTIAAQNGTEEIIAWVEVQPRDDGVAGCDIRLRNWRTSPLSPEDPEVAAALREDIDRHLAELWATLDGAQVLLSVECNAPDLATLAASMRAGIGHPWTDFVTVSGMSHRQPLHWRLLDGASLEVAGSDRSWRAALLPLTSRGGEPEGFELLLTAQEPPVGVAKKVAVTGSHERENTTHGIIGQQIAPVLRQPIARIIANAETIRTRMAGPLAEAYANYASDITHAGQHLLGLLDDLADLEVVEADDFTTAPDLIDLAEVARQAAGILGVRAKEKDIVIDAPPHGESVPIIAEFRRVLQILLNLVGNAIRYSPDGSQIWLRLERDGPNGRIVVADQGPGLAEDDSQVVFEKFERLGRSGDGGSGLGLYISRRLARAMNGDLTVESAPGQGARFILELPGAEED